MKVAIMTFIRAYNYGATLQAYALNKVINNLGADCETIDYYPDYFYDTYNFTYLGKKRIIPFRPLSKWKNLLIVDKNIKRRNKRFNDFISENIKLSNMQYKNSSELANISDKYDTFISGSDQVWNNVCAKFDSAYFLDFVADNKKKNSFAVSFGFDKVPNNLRNMYIQRLKDFNNYSVREDSGVEIIADIANKKAIKCCDPTFLLDKQGWEKVVADKLFKKPYILVYGVNISEELINYASKLSKQKQMKVIFLTSPQNYENLLKNRFKEYGFINESKSGPKEFVTLFHNAKYVVTNSFHGTAFSVIFERQFVLISKLGSGKTNNRSVDLLNTLSLDNRILKDTEKDIVDDKIDWASVEGKLNCIKEDSMNYLKSLIC